jgi:hypothetical protein
MSRLGSERKPKTIAAVMADPVRSNASQPRVTCCSQLEPPFRTEVVQRRRKLEWRSDVNVCGALKRGGARRIRWLIR